MTIIVHSSIDSSRAFEKAINSLHTHFLRVMPFDRGSVHAQSTSGDPSMHTRELRHVTLELEVPISMGAWQSRVSPNLPWAENHFAERVGGVPLNPPPEEANWPFAQSGNAAHKDPNQKFSHTYPERIWPKWAGVGQDQLPRHPHRGIRYEYGDLNDLVRVLVKNPRSRQAYLPIWFPEDLSAARQELRVPCSLGYHFILTDANVLECVYTLRSCDALRFLRDDLYMAGRLLQWVGEQTAITIDPSTMCRLVVHIDNLHIFEGDVPRVTDLVRDFDPRSSYDFGSMF